MTTSCGWIYIWLSVTSSVGVMAITLPIPFCLCVCFGFLLYIYMRNLSHRRWKHLLELLNLTVCTALYIFLYPQHQHTQAQQHTHGACIPTASTIHICSLEPLALKGINNTVKSYWPPNDPIWNVPSLRLFECTTGILCSEISSFFSGLRPPPSYPSSPALSPCPAAHSQPIKHAAWRGFRLCSPAKSLGSRKKKGGKREKRKKAATNMDNKAGPDKQKRRWQTLMGGEWDIFPAKCSRISFSWSPGGASAGRHFLPLPPIAAPDCRICLQTAWQ